MNEVELPVCTQLPDDITECLCKIQGAFPVPCILSSTCLPCRPVFCLPCKLMFCLPSNVPTLPQCVKVIFLPYSLPTLTVLTWLYDICLIVCHKNVDEFTSPCEGQLYLPLVIPYESVARGRPVSSVFKERVIHNVFSEPGLLWRSACMAYREGL